jgi:predicted SAM-dependent methyltransferase
VAPEPTSNLNPHAQHADETAQWLREMRHAIQDMPAPDDVWGMVQKDQPVPIASPADRAVEVSQLGHPIKLHIGGEVRKEGWAILNIAPAPYVDYVGHCKDLSFLADGSCTEVYASHVLEHLGYDGELQAALKEINRVLAPSGRLRASVPDLEILCRLFLHPNSTNRDRFFVMRMMYGGRANPYDIHYSGLFFDYFGSMLHDAGFRDIRRVERFGEFEDGSDFKYQGIAISLNVEARK